MAIHQVSASMKSLDLSKAGSAISLDINCDGDKLGTIKIGHGSMMWRTANGKKFKRIGWSEFAKLADSL